jgi:hypothetical protein
MGIGVDLPEGGTWQLAHGILMDLKDYRESRVEQERIQSLLSLIPGKSHSALDVGARDGYVSVRLTEFFDAVTALDLEKPRIDHPAVACTEGDLRALPFADNSFDLVMCAEVLEHIPPQALGGACAELARVTSKHLVVGVPYKQDTRSGRTTCWSCGKTNPPWGHVNSFDETLLGSLFDGLTWERKAFVGVNRVRTNFLSAFLMDFAGNPYGTYSQDEACIHCGQKLKGPPPRNVLQKVSTKLAFMINDVQSYAIVPQANWIHVLFSKNR